MTSWTDVSWRQLEKAYVSWAAGLSLTASPQRSGPGLANHEIYQSEDMGYRCPTSNSVVREQPHLAPSRLVPDGIRGGLMRIYKLQQENINWKRL